MPLVSRTFDQLIDFSRTSAATYVDATGKIVTTSASRNLLTYTQEFDNAAWNKATGGSVAANTTVAPDGTTTADSYTFGSSTTSFAYLSQAVTAVSTNTHTFSIWMKRPSGTGSRTIRLRISDVTISTGTSSNFTVTESWQRFEYTRASASSTGQVGAGLLEGSTGTPLTAGEVVEVWGAQLELGSTASTYTRNVAGTFPPRLDYDPVTLAPKGLLIEEQRTNLLTYSEQFDNAAWLKFNATVTANALVSPDGSADADTVVASAGAGYHYTAQRPTVSAGVTYTASMYVKAGTTRYIGFGDAGDAAWHSAYLDTTNGAILNQTNCTATATAVGNGWFRITSTFTRTNASYAEIYVGGSDTTNNTAPNFTAAGTETCHVYGAQLEAGAFATSYIPTVASQVTRTADVANIVAPNFAPWYNQSEGTWVVELQKLSPSSTATYGVEVTGASSNFSMRVRLGTDARLQSVDGGVAVVDAQLAASVPTTVSKYGIAYKLNDYAGSAGGAAAVTDTSATVPALSALSIGSAGVTNLYVRSIRYYPTRLSNAQLQALTA